MMITTKKRKILYVITKGNWGGAQRYVYDLAVHLPREEFEPVVACGSEGVLTRKLREVSIRTVLLPTLQRDIFLGKELKALSELLRLFNAERPDIIHLNSSKAAFLGALASRLISFLSFLAPSAYPLAPKIIFTAHGWPFKEERPMLAKLMLYAATWFTVLLSHHTIVVSREDEKTGKRMRFVKEKIHYISIAVPDAMKTSWFLSKEKAMEILFNPSPTVDSHIINSIRLVTIAELTENKGLRYSIDMMRELEQRFPNTYTYTIFGKGEDLPYLQEHTRGLVNSQNQPTVLFRGISTNMPADLSTEASKYLRAFDIFILPSIKEGMPYVLLEAAAAELPIVATDVVREEAATLPYIRFVRPKDGHALALAIQSIKKEPPPARTEAVARSFPATLKQTVALYRATR